MATNLGTTKQGYPICARGCAEDNSGVVYRCMGMFVVSCAYPIDEDSNGNPLYTLSYATEAEAVEMLRVVTGIARLQQFGPDY